MNWTLIWTALGTIAAIIGVIYSIYGSDIESKSIVKSKPSIVKETKTIINKSKDYIDKNKSYVINQSANDIFQWYQNIKKAGNGLEAQELVVKKYIGKYITVSGKIQNIEPSSLYTNGATIIIDSGNDNKSILVADFTDKNDVYSLNKNSIISINGKIVTLNEDFISINDSKIIEK